MAKRILNNLETGEIIRGKINDNYTELYSVVDPDNNTVIVDTVSFNTDYTVTGSEVLGQEFWDNDSHTKSIVLEYGVNLQQGLELLKFGTDEGNNFFEGAAVSVKGVSGNRVAFELTDSSATSTNYKHFVGLLTSVPDSGNRFVLRDGDINGINTAGGLSFGNGETWNENDDIWVDPVNNGYLTNVEPSAGTNKIYVGKVTVKSATIGQISTMYRVFCRLEDLTNVNGTSLDTNGQILVWDNDNGYFDFDYNILNRSSTFNLAGLSVGTSTNNTTVESDGTLKFNGDAAVWEDLNFDIVNAGGPAATLPDYVTIGNVYYREFTSLNNQTCGDGAEIPHNYRLSSTIYPHIHIFLKSGESAGTTGVTFRLYYSYRQTGVAAVSGSVDLTATSTELTNEPYKLNLYDVTGFTGPSTLGGQLALRLDRISGNAGDVIVTTFGVHYEIDTIGSRTISTK